MKAVFLDYATMGDGLSLEPLEAAVDELSVYEHTSDSDVAAHIGDADAVLTNKIRLTPELLQAAPNLRFIGLTATGTDNIDLDTARKLDIAVANIRGYCTQSVVEHVFGVLLMLTHSLADYRQSVRDGRWQRSQNPFLLDHPIRELSAMTMGIVGHGELGKGVAATARHFGMRVLVSARPGSGTVAEGRTPFNELLQRVDVLSLHCPLNDDTRNLIGADELARMKQSAILINTARGGLVDSRALAGALAGGVIAAAAVDVLPKEPPVDGDPLLDYDGGNLIVTPHIAWATGEARQNAIDELARNIAAFRDGRRRNRVV
ncbi:MAG: D-2-hydroxyacid dehydrogenase [Woeseiaceae bacterium]|nr:D-2-hydroxyacid dehydrogenase [Woeseiaceae bacterium]